MKKKNWYEELFENFAETYEKEPFTKGTTGEVDFIEQEIGHNKAIEILDIGCGTGRHAVELASRGYKVTGIDLSESQLEYARHKAQKRGVEVEFIRADARHFSFPGRFGLAIMICEGAFPLMETDEMNFAILKNAFDALNDDGILIFTTLNALFPLFHSVKDFINAQAGDTSRTGKNSFDLMTFRDHSVYETLDDQGRKKVLDCNERYYTPSEISWLLKSLGFGSAGIYACRLGAFSRKDTLTTRDYEMLVIARKEKC